MTDAESEATAPEEPGQPSGAADEPDGGGSSEPVAEGTGQRGRDVEVPFEVYKAVTVFSTLFAVGAVVLGFVLLDWGTERATADLSDVNVAITLAGLASIAVGAGTYAFSTRFRARGMGNAKDGAD
ncbi:MAG: hypothetical protein V5A62_03720 [Haloarculaceae archaeon]